MSVVVELSNRYTLRLFAKFYLLAVCLILNKQHEKIAFPMLSRGTLGVLDLNHEQVF